MQNCDSHLQLPLSVQEQDAKCRCLNGEADTGVCSYS